MDVSARNSRYGLAAVLLVAAACAPGKRASEVAAQQHADSLIAASQAGALPVFFNPASPATPRVVPGAFHDSLECRVRGGLPNFFQKAAQGEPITVGYIGGSITRGNNMYRNQSARFLHGMFPGVKMTAINAGVSGTGADLGACRIREQLLRYHPDLVFIEFAVNGAFAPGVEGMIRQVWDFDPSIDICLLYTISQNQTRLYAAGRIPQNIRGLEAVADHYHIPSIHMGLEPSTLEQAGKLRWKGPAAGVPGKIVFSADGLHPLTAGGNLYAAAIARGMLKMRARERGPHPHRLPPPLAADNWEDARMLDPLKAATFTGAWERVDPLATDSLRSFAPWFSYILRSGAPGAAFTVRFRGTRIGIFDIGGPEMGQLLVTVDGEQKAVLNRFNRYSDNRYRGQYVFVPVSPGIHTVTFRISREKADKAAILGAHHSGDITRHPARYAQTAVLLGKLLIKGTLLPAAR